MKPRHRRLILVIAGLAALSITAALVLKAFRSNLVFYFTPTQVADHQAPVNETFRIGGLVERGTLKHLPDGLTVQFVVTDTAKSIPVRYTGMLPDLFSEGKGVVAQGRLEPDGVFVAQQVLAKHDANYMPPEAAAALKAAHSARLAQ
jgi:cytochrome c-type biogenesis protein CcmE